MTNVGLVNTERVNDSVWWEDLTPGLWIPEYWDDADDFAGYVILVLDDDNQKNRVYICDSGEVALADVLSWRKDKFVKFSGKLELSN